ncbi:MAG: glycosyltransferase family 2 protein, partial [Candidatus Limnocylindrales bacterium]
MGRQLGLPPHPLFDPDYFAKQHAAVINDWDPLAYYLTEPKSRKASPHPLFDVAAYVARIPAAKVHPLGPLGHYVEVGASRGLRPNDWYVPDPLAEPNGLIDWIEKRATAWAVRARAASPPWQSMPPVDPAAQTSPELDAGVPTTSGPDHPLVSVVLIVGDDPALVPDMIRTVADQTIRDWELLIVHAREDSQLATFLEAYADDTRVRLLRQPSAGVNAARNFGISAARGDYLAWISAGDTWTP